MSIALWIALASCVAMCYFGACNIALKLYSRAKLADLLERQGRIGRLDELTACEQDYVLMTGVFRATLNLVVLLAVLYDLEARAWDWAKEWNYVLGFVIVAALVSVFAVALPTSWAKYQTESLVARSLPLLRALHAGLRPLILLLRAFDPFVRRITGADLPDNQGGGLTDEVLSVVEQHEDSGGVGEVQKQMLEAVFDLSSTEVSQVMTPRTDVKGIDVTSSLAEVKHAALEFGHSRIPVYENSLDHIMGLLYVKDLIRFLGDDAHFDLRSVLREPYLVPQSKKVQELLAEFKQRKVHLALVLDEYGGTAGLVTIEDVLEEIVGDIQDEYERHQPQPGVKQLDADRFEVDARIRIDALNDEMDVALPEDEDYDTLGGFVSAKLGHIPRTGESFEFNRFRFTVTAAQRTHASRVKIEKPPDEPDRDASHE